MKRIMSISSPSAGKKLKTSMEVNEGLTRQTVSETVFVPDSAHVQEQEVIDSDWPSY
jgi:hypothetical protein